jgi:hypothetical protein
MTDGTLPLGKPEDNFVGLTKPEWESSSPTTSCRSRT